MVCSNVSGATSGALTKVGATNINRGYTGHQMDTDLIYMNARYENPSSGQFLSPDDVTQALGDDVLTKAYTGNNTQSCLHNPQGLHTYSYTRNNPVMYTDPDGKCPVCVAGLIWLGSIEGIATVSTAAAVLENIDKLHYIL